MNRKRLLSLCVVLVTSISLRFVDLGKQGLFLDEAWSWAKARMNLLDIVLASLTKPHPPLYFLLLKLSLAVLPSSEAGLRALSACASVASLLVVFFFVRSRWDTRSAVCVGLLMAVSSFDIYYAQEARMYTLLGFFWIVSYTSVVKALEGSRKHLVVWVVASILMAWTHSVGILVALSYVAFLLGLLLGQRKLGILQPWKTDCRPLLASIAGVVIGVLPSLALLLIGSSRGAGGAWIPKSKDLVALFLLWSTGIASVREHFLDSTHLVLPLLSGWSTIAWTAIGTITVGIPAALGVSQAWKRGGRLRAELTLATTLLAVPSALLFGYAALSQHQAWALKPFLGAEYILYVWVGVGLASIPMPTLRRCLGGAILLVAAASLVPYYTEWHKSTVSISLRSLPELTSGESLLVEPPRIAPLAFYYAGTEAAVYSVSQPSGQAALLWRIQYSNRSTTGSYGSATCEELALITDFWVVGDHDQILQAAQNWPQCIVAKKLWGFEDSRWQRLP